MNAHFSVINKKGTVVAALLTLAGVVLFSLCLAELLGGGSKLWLLPFIAAAVFFIICIMVLVSVLTAGIDIRDGVVILPDLDPSKGKQPKFQISELESVTLQDGGGNTLNADRDNLSGARIAFHLKDGQTEIYYPVSITPKQFRRIKDGLENRP